jgi:SAM-dependent methyltransferase
MSLPRVPKREVGTLTGLGVRRGLGQPARRIVVWVSTRSRAQKLETILAHVPAGARVLAVGVEGDGGYALGCSDTGNQIERGLLRAGRDVTAVAFFAVPTSLGDDGAALLRGDGRHLPFVDDAFDVVLSNAVLEHVGGPEEAQKFVVESLRVAKALAIHATPNRWFPLETHTRIPLVHWLPRRLHPRLFRRRSAYRWSDDDWLFSKQEVLALSPGGRMIGGWPSRWPISFLVAWGSPSPGRPDRRLRR